MAYGLPCSDHTASAFSVIEDTRNSVDAVPTLIDRKKNFERKLSIDKEIQYSPKN